jgi:hypothetical protein
MIKFEDIKIINNAKWIKTKLNKFLKNKNKKYKLKNSKFKNSKLKIKKLQKFIKLNKIKLKLKLK